jgi:uncharacterized LabA/DUF88 family protein
MAIPNDNPSMALFCDFENLALGVRDAQYDKFDIRPVLERLLLKGSIVVKKAYCDWERYKGFKAVMHEANFELIEIPHVRQSGKNSADIRLVVDALDLCYTKTHVDTFVILSGDSDFSPLVSKLRENAKQVIGVGIKQSTSDLLVANCDEFIFYDDLVRESQRRAGKREAQQGGGQAQAPRRSPEEEKRRREDQDARRTRGVELAVETFEALQAERGDTGKIWASVLKEAIKRRKPDFSESNYAFRTFGNLLEEASARGLLGFGRDEKSGAYVFRGNGTPVRQEPRGDDAPRSMETHPGEPRGIESAAAMEPRESEDRPIGIYEARARAQRQNERAQQGTDGSEQAAESGVQGADHGPQEADSVPQGGERSPQGGERSPQGRDRSQQGRDRSRQGAGRANSRHHFNEPLVHPAPDTAPAEEVEAQPSGDAYLGSATGIPAPRGPRESREPREGREARESREPREPRDAVEGREPRRRSRGGRGRNAGARDEVEGSGPAAVEAQAAQAAPVDAPPPAPAPPSAPEPVEVQAAGTIAATDTAKAPDTEDTASAQAPTPAKRPRRPRKPAAPKGDAA